MPDDRTIAVSFRPMSRPVAYVRKPKVTSNRRVSGETFSGGAVNGASRRIPRHKRWSTNATKIGLLVVALVACGPVVQVSIPPSDATGPSMALNVFGVPAGLNPGQSVEPVTVGSNDTPVFKVVQGATLSAVARADDADGGLWFVEVGVSYVQHCGGDDDLGEASNVGYGDMTVATGFANPANWAPGNPLPSPLPIQAPATLSHSIKVELPKGCAARQGWIHARAVNATGTEVMSAKFNFEAG